MVFQKPNPFPKTIFDNVAYGPRINGTQARELGDIVEHALDARRAVGRGEGQAQAERPLVVGWPAAAPVHRARARGRARRRAHGRAVLGARPDRHRAHRGPHGGAQARVHDRDRHAQHAAGRARRPTAPRSSPPRSTTRAGASAGSSSSTSPRSIFTAPVRSPHRGLHHRPVRLRPRARSDASERRLEQALARSARRRPKPRSIERDRLVAPRSTTLARRASSSSTPTAARCSATGRPSASATARHADARRGRSRSTSCSTARCNGEACERELAALRSAARGALSCSAHAARSTTTAADRCGRVRRTTSPRSAASRACAATSSPT